MKTALMLLLVGLVLLSGVGLASDADMPLWFQHPPQIEGKVAAVAVGDGMPEALTVALGELASTLSMTVSGDGTNTRSYTSRNFGDLQVRQMVKSWTSEEDAESVLTSVIKVMWAAPADTSVKVEARYLDEQVVAGEDTAHAVNFEFSRTDAGMPEILAELERAGIEMESHESPDHRHYIMLTCPAE